MEYGPPMCTVCARLISTPKRSGEKPTCSAFPEGIPQEIYFQRGDHRVPWPGDNGQQFVQDAGKPPLKDIWEPG